MQKLKQQKMWKKYIIVAYWNRGAYKGKGTRITSANCITIEITEGNSFKDLLAAAKEIREQWPDLKGKRMTIIVKGDAGR